MVHYILRTVYNSVFRHDDSPGGAVTNLLAAQIDLAHLNTKFVFMPDCPFLAVFCTMFSVKAQSVPLCLGDSQISL